MDLLNLNTCTHSSRRLHAFDETEENNDPGERQTAEQLPADARQVINAVRDLQHVAPVANNKLVRCMWAGTDMKATGM